jgi:isocitrate dehydrogenase
MATYKHATVPAKGERIEVSGGAFRIPDQPIIPFIEGDGTGPDIWRASVRVFDAAVEQGVRRQAQDPLDGGPRR